mgnify:CR=1 FL=1
MTTEWVDIDEKGYPDFMVHGFHTDCQIWVKLESGEDRLGHYHNYGMFSVDGGPMLDNVVAWRLENDQLEDNQHG